MISERQKGLNTSRRTQPLSRLSTESTASIPHGRAQGDELPKRGKLGVGSRCVRVWAFTWVCACICTHVHGQACVYTHACVYVYMRVHVRAGMQLREKCVPSVFMCKVNICMNMGVCVHGCVHACVCAHVLDGVWARPVRIPTPVAVQLCAALHLDRACGSRNHSLFTRPSPPSPSVLVWM